MYIPLIVFSLFWFAGVHEPQSGPPAQRLRHHSRWQLGYLRDCFITAREVPDVHCAHLRPASSSCRGHRAQALPPRPQHPAERSRIKRSRQWLREDRAAITPEDCTHQRSDFSSMIGYRLYTLYVMIINMCLNV